MLQVVFLTFIICLSHVTLGKEAGLLAGLEAADGDLITVMDADLQDPPELLINMYQKILEGYDVVGTRRADRKGEPVIVLSFLRCFIK